MNIRAVVVLALAGAGCQVVGAWSQTTRGPALAMTEVTVIPFDTERVLTHQTVIVRGGVIAELGPAGRVRIPDDAVRIDGNGRYLMPGLTDAHVHLRHPSELVSYLAHGVTTVVHLSGPSGSIPDVLALRDRVARGDVVGPTIFTSGRMLDGDPPIFAGVSTVVRTPDEARRAVDAQLASGVDLIKVYNNLRPAALGTVVRAAHDRGAAVWGHIPRAAGRADALQRALGAGLDVIAHGEEIFFTLLYRDVERQVDQGRVPVVEDALLTEAVQLIRRDGAAVIPNLSFVAMTRAQLDDAERVWGDSEARYLALAVRDMWRQQTPARRADLARFDLRERGKQPVVRRLTRALHEAGVPLLLGTDASAPGMFPGKSAHLELAELVAAGLTPFQALASATTQAGRLLHRSPDGRAPFGTVAAGSQANLVLLDANPLTDIAHASRIAGVVVQGRWYTRDELARLRTAAPTPPRSVPTRSP